MAGNDERESPFAGLPGDVGDDREKFVRVTLASGEQVEHGDVYYRYTAEEFIVAPTVEFEESGTTRYRKGEVVRVEVLQHHAACFVTTAVTDERGSGDETLEALRAFRDDVLGRSLPGRALVGLYYATSPPIARTLERHPGSRTAAIVRRIVDRCAGLLDRRERHSRARARGPVSALVTLLYVAGLLIAAAGAAVIRALEVARGRRTAPGSGAGGTRRRR